MDRHILAAVCLQELGEPYASRVVVERNNDDDPVPWAHVLVDLITAAGNTIVDRGRELKTGHEPLHSSSSGTCLSINPTRGVWFCSSCQRGGGSIGWVIDVHNLSYQSACAWLTLHYGTPSRE